jgi:hypothetical protein
MSRKSITLTISEEGRDKGKVFQITEMPASKAEKWALRALLALAKSGVEIPEDVMDSGVAALLEIGIKALLRVNFVDAEPLLDELFDCVKFVPSQDITRILVEDDTEEIATRIKLRKEVIVLHMSFFTNVAPSI